MGLIPKMTVVSRPPAAGDCRICECALSARPLLRYENMPGLAQHLPDVRTVRRDRGIDLDVFMCSGCGLVQLDMKPVSYYREVIRAVGVSKEMREFRLRQFRDFLRRYSLRGKKVLEVGCGSGEYLALIGEAGARAFGLEYSEASVRECRRSGLKADRGFIENEATRVPRAPFDAFMILSFLEHLPRPNDVLRGIRRNVSPGAVGIVEVPNFDMMLRGNLFSEFMRDHLFYFTKETLGFALRRNGFEVLSCESVWHEYILSAVVRNREVLDLSPFIGAQKKLKKEIDAFVRRHRRVAVWGAGHQAFALMSLARLGGRIRYVVDSALFKQGKFTPATHIPIVAPEALRSDPVDAVIVMTGSYSDEVKAIIKRDFSPRLKTAVVREAGLETD